MQKSFRPLSGNLLSLHGSFFELSGDNLVFVPYRGIYFLYRCKDYGNLENITCFRPLSGNLLSLPFPALTNLAKAQCFRPLSGNLLSLPMENHVKKIKNLVFSSPIGESTFSTMHMDKRACKRKKVFVPYRGIYFLYYCRSFIAWKTD